VSAPTRICGRGHVVIEGVNGRRDHEGYLECMTCRQLRRRGVVAPMYGRAPANPWAGERDCPSCGSAEWTMPWDTRRDPMWRCIECHLTFIVCPVCEAGSLYEQPASNDGWRCPGCRLWFDPTDRQRTYRATGTGADEG
jgi:hypothetical protein